MEWGKNICEQISDKGLLPKIYEELTQLNSQKIPPKQKNLNEKTQVIQLQDGQKTWIDIFQEKIYERPTGTWKEAQHPIIREMQIKATMWYHLMPVKVASSKG